jgi:hypothetical protein
MNIACDIYRLQMIPEKVSEGRHSENPSEILRELDFSIMYIVQEKFCKHGG